MASPEKSGLPDFIIIGAQKCGTSALKHSLGAHAGIAMPATEMHFFNSPKKWEQGLDWYMQHFPHTNLLQGEKTPDYLDSPRAAKRMHRIVPHAKLIILLRDPVDRAYSHWNHMMQSIEQTASRGWELVSFEEALARAYAEVKPFDRMLRKGKYIDHILNFLEYFPAQQIHIGIQERFFLEGARELNKVLDFLGLTPNNAEPAKHHVREYPAPINPDTEQELLQFFEPYNQRLFEFLGDDLPEWRRINGVKS